MLQLDLVVNLNISYFLSLFFCFFFIDDVELTSLRVGLIEVNEKTLGASFYILLDRLSLRTMWVQSKFFTKILDLTVVQYPYDTLNCGSLSKVIPVLIRGLFV